MHHFSKTQMESYDIIVRICHFCNIKNLKSLRFANSLISSAAFDELLRCSWIDIKNCYHLVHKIRLIKCVKGVLFCNIDFPPNITHLKFHKLFNKPIDTLPLQIQFIHLNSQYNKPLNNLPNNLKFLICGDNFNRNVDNLPDRVEFLQFSHKFNQNVDHLPKSLTTLLFAWIKTIISTKILISNRNKCHFYIQKQ
jgi:hypothetical protein